MSAEMTDLNFIPRPRAAELPSGEFFDKLKGVPIGALLCSVGTVRSCHFKSASLSYTSIGVQLFKFHIGYGKDTDLPGTAGGGILEIEMLLFLSKERNRV